MWRLFFYFCVEALYARACLLSPGGLWGILRYLSLWCGVEGVVCVSGFVFGGCVFGP